MAAIPKKYLKELGDLLADGHRRFGKVAPRKPYKEDEEDGGTGSAQLLFEEHPLLSSMPIGAPSDLTFLTNNNQFSQDKAEERVEQATPELKKQLEATLEKKLGKHLNITPTPYNG
ncbi:MAG: hypothetical protein A2X78_00695 [Gammaproteobacteria bacterium GWE2_37_16]|nr:MAG: hypothetical protein A2X78_00695 [Gammaproteobacteria bacterium GWE2_37_16]